MVYMPNTGFYDAAAPNRQKSFVFREVELEFPPVNWEQVQGKKYGPENDFLVFYLKENVTCHRQCRRVR